MGIRGKNVPERWNSRFKGPALGSSQAFSRNREEASVAGSRGGFWVEEGHDLT